MVIQMSRTKDWLTNVGLGILLSKLRFSTTAEKVHTGVGYRLKRKIDITYDSDQELPVQMWIEESGLPPLPATANADVTEWLDTLEPYAHLLTKQRYYDTMVYTFNNPVPSTSYDDFIDWAEEFDRVRDEN